MVISIIANKIKETGLWNMGRKLPLETIKARLKFESAIGPKITPMTNGAMGYFIFIRAKYRIPMSSISPKLNIRRPRE